MNRRHAEGNKASHTTSRFEETPRVTSGTGWTDMTFCKSNNKRTLDTSTGSSFSRPQAKRGRMEDQLNQNGESYVSGNSAVTPLNLFYEGESKDKTWRPTRIHHEEYDQESTRCRDSSIAHDHKDQRASESESEHPCSSCPPGEVSANVTGWCDQCSEYLCQECIT